MFERLRSYYQSVGISAMDFHCQHHKACKGDCATFIEATEAFVGW